MPLVKLTGLVRSARRDGEAAAPSPPGREDRFEESFAPVHPGEQRVAFDESGAVIRVESGGLLAKLGIKPGRPLWRQLEGVSPLLQDLLVNGSLHDVQETAIVPVTGRSGEGMLLRLRALTREGLGRALAISVVPESSARADELALGLQGHLDMVSRVVSLASGSLTTKDAAKEILRTVSERTRMDAAALYVLRAFPSAALFAAFGKTRRRGVPYPLIDCRHHLLAPLFEGVPLIALSVPGAELPKELADVCTRDAAHVLLLSVSTSDGVTGLLVLSSVMQRRLDSSALHALRLAAQVLGLVVQRDLLSAESERSSAVMETAYAVSRTISRSLDLEHTFQVVATNAARLVRGTRCLLFELEAESGDLVAVASSQASPVDLTGLRLRLNLHTAERMLHKSHLQMEVADLVWGAPVPSDVRDALGFRTALLLPMLAHNQLIGSLVLLSPERDRPLSAHDIALAEEVADQAAVAIHNARLYRDLAVSRHHVQALMSRMARIREQERRDLASIVHDDIIQTVVGSVYKLEAAKDGLPPDLQKPFSDAIGILQGTISEARHVISDLRPPALEGIGLLASLRALVDHADDLGPANVTLVVDDLPELAPGKATALHRIVREAVVNAQRHARARCVWVTIGTTEECDQRVVLLTIRDDGRGWAKGDAPVSDHFGMAMMEEQAALAGGTLTIKAVAGEGVAVHAAIPIDE